MAEGLLPGIHGCVFDAYGTLFDVGSAASGCRDQLGDNADEPRYIETVPKRAKRNSSRNA